MKTEVTSDYYRSPVPPTIGALSSHFKNLPRLNHPTSLPRPPPPNVTTSPTLPPRFRRLCNLSARAPLSWSQQHFCETAYDNRQHLTFPQHFKAKRLRLRGERRGAEASPAPSPVPLSAVRPSTGLMHQNTVLYVQKCVREKAFSPVGSKVSGRPADWIAAGSEHEVFFLPHSKQTTSLEQLFLQIHLLTTFIEK